MMVAAAVYNRMHGQPNLSKVPPNGIEDILISCAMLVYDASEVSAKRIWKSVRR